MELLFVAITESSCRAFRDFCRSLAAIDIDTARLTFFPGAERKLPANKVVSKVQPYPGGGNPATAPCSP